MKILVIFLTVFSLKVSAGPHVIGNGDQPENRQSYEFVDTAKEVLKAVKASTVPEKTMLLSAADKLYVGSSKHAKNDMEFYLDFGIILINPFSFESRKSLVDRGVFVVRGLLLAAQIEDSDYRRSAEIIKDIGFGEPPVYVFKYY